MSLSSQALKVSPDTTAKRSASALSAGVVRHSTRAVRPAPGARRGLPGLPGLRRASVVAFRGFLPQDPSLVSAFRFRH